MSRAERSRYEKAWFVVGVALLWASGARADHCPEESVAAGKPETRLAGIDLSGAHIEDLVRRFGAPAKVAAGPCHDCEPGTGANITAWRVEGATVTAFSEYYHDGAGKKIETVLRIRIEGLPPARGLRTGRGAGLGDSAARIQSIYGRRYLAHPVNGAKLAGTMRTYCFSDETELGLGFSGGRVTSMELSISEE
jgi:hypothetical protein